MSQNELSDENGRRLKIAAKSNTESKCCDAKTKSSCCDQKKTLSKEESAAIAQQINSLYSATARNFNEYSDAEQQKIQAIAKVFGYSAQELSEIGTDANMGLSCGNPVRQANLKKGEVVLDLGCGAGMDLFLAKKYIGDSKDGGELLGVDFSKDMIAKVNRNAQRKKDRKGVDISNMKFMHAEIEHMEEAVGYNRVDCVISNCVMNLVQNKLSAFKEVYRVLKANGGRVCLSDIALKKELPLKWKNDITAITNCIGGAILAKEYEELLYKAGFKNVQLVNKNVDLNVWKECWWTMVGDGDEKKESVGCCGGGGQKKESSGCCGGSNDKNDNLSAEKKETMKQLLDETDLNDYVASYYVFAFK